MELNVKTAEVLKRSSVNLTKLGEKNLLATKNLSESRLAPLTADAFEFSAKNDKFKLLRFKNNNSSKANVEYAKKHFGIKSIDPELDVESLNWINESFTNLYNKYKGNISFPPTIKATELKKAMASIEFPDDAEIFSSDDFILHINKNSIEKVIKNVTDNVSILNVDLPFLNPNKQRQANLLLKKKNLTRYEKLCLKEILHDVNLYNSLLKFEPSVILRSMYKDKKLIPQLMDTMGEDFKTISELEKLSEAEQHKYIQNAYNMIKSLQANKDIYINFLHRNLTPATTINHEIGHMQHLLNITPTECCKQVENTSWLINNLKKSDTTRSVSAHAASLHPLEFIADTYAGSIDGTKFPDDVMDLYYSYNGAKLPS